MSFLVDQKTSKEKIQLQLSKFDGQKEQDFKKNKIKNFAILSRKKHKYICQKRMRNRKIIPAWHATSS